MTRPEMKEEQNERRKERGTKDVSAGLPEDRDELSYKSIFDHASDAIYIQDRNGCFIDVNPAASEMYGYSREEFIGSTPDMLSAPGKNNPQKTARHLELAFAGAPQRFEWWGKRKTGEIFPKEVVLNRGTYFGKEVVFAMARDISDRFSAIEALKKSEDKYRSLTNQLPVGVYRSTPGGQLIYANPTLVKMLNYDSVDELLKLNVKDLYIRKSDREKQIREAQQTSEVIQSEFQLKRKSRDPIWVIDNARLLFDNEGRPEYFDGVLEDITERKKAEESLKQKDIVYHTLFEAAKDGILILHNNLFMDCNQAAIEMFGCSDRDDLIGQSPWEMSPSVQPDGKKSKDKASLVISRAMSGKPQRFYWKHMKINGDTFDVEVSLNKIDIGDQVYIQSIVRDMTESMRSELKIRENEANLKAIIENSLESIWSANRNYEIQYVNEVFIEAFRRSFGVTLHKGINIIEALPEGIREKWKERYDRVFSNEHFIFEEEIETVQGKLFIEVVVNPIVVDGEVVAAAFYGKDVTGKRIAEEELKKQASLKQLLIDISSTYINLPLESIEPAIDKSLGVMGRFIGAEMASIYIYDFESKVCRRTHQWHSPGHGPTKEESENIPFSHYEEPMKSHMEGNFVNLRDVQTSKISALRRLPQYKNVRSLISVPMMSNIKCIGFVEFTSHTRLMEHSVTERELLMVYAQILVNTRLRMRTEEELIKAKEKAEESDRLKSAFLANMSHEIRTPMNGILGFMELLKAPDLSEQNKANYLQIVSKSGERLLDTINNIIEISKIEAGEINLSLSEVRIGDLLSYFRDFYTQQTRQKGLDFRLSNRLTGGTRTILTDRFKLESIIENLLKNAIKFTHKGYIEFGCHNESGEIVFYVKDTGTGIRKERLNSVFDRFVQADLSNTRPHEGSGLGLSIVKAYTEMLGGRVAVESKQDSGSTFFVYLPVKQF